MYNVVMTVTDVATGRTIQRDLSNEDDVLYAIRVVAESMTDEFRPGPDWDENDGIIGSEMVCYECGGFSGKGPLRKVAKVGPTVDRADPTETYVLECGHTTIAMPFSPEDVEVTS